LKRREFLMNKLYYFECFCRSPEHTLRFAYFEDDIKNWPFLDVDVHLTKLPFFKRLWYGIRYIFGKQSKFGAFEEVVLERDQVALLTELGSRFLIATTPKER